MLAACLNLVDYFQKKNAVNSLDCRKQMILVSQVVVLLGAGNTGHLNPRMGRDLLPAASSESVYL
jgi:hypothetical protein